MPLNLPFIVLQALAHNFIHVSSRFGFFMDVREFHDAITGARSASSHLLPPVILHVLYLWGIHLHVSRHRQSNGALAAYEPALLSHALRSVANAMSGSTSQHIVGGTRPTPAHPTTILHALQAIVLLAHYFIRNTRLLEAHYQIGLAVSISISAGLHRVRDSNSDAANAFWAVVRLNAFRASFEPKTTDVQFTGTGRVTIHTPWPDCQVVKNMEDEDSIVDEFLADNSASQDRGTSAAALLAKASILFQVSANRSLDAQEYESLSFKLAAFSRVVEEFLHPFSPSEQPNQVFVAHMLVQGASIQLSRQHDHKGIRPSDDARRAAESITQRLSSTDLSQFGEPDFILTCVWVSACFVFVDDVRYSKARGMTYETSAMSLKTLIRTMDHFATSSGFMRAQCAEICTIISEMGLDAYWLDSCSNARK
ncbi:Zn(2)-C6 fungal-type domain-containing protein [Mycena indigotica]|uniref:Zn(2)-C6 fungal-type domain-containing protein n=1 Tax=Mycena indigotica TaxID=2126181 RepID=A0A8H6VRH8_9AGAR|nr:Zn(2)-C6 fungal-type domain-containing protein [Mycena indigotica]KAF7291119.1 Zn(2)-C6 fungal-type domain-containing protein [Mycena indigotica]